MKKSTYILVALFLGALGIHKFMQGKIFGGLIRLTITVLSLGFLGWVLPVIDILMIAGKPTDNHGYLVNK